MDDTYQHILVQMTNLARMINNLSNRLNLVENATVNSQTQRNPLHPNVSQTEQSLLDSLNIRQINDTNTFNTFPTRQQYNPNLYSNSNLRRPPIRPEPRQPDTEYINPLWNINTTQIPQRPPRVTNANANTTTTATPTVSARASGNDTPPRRRLPNLHTPEVRRSYNPDGTLDSVEMTFTNLISPQEMNNIVRTATNGNSPRPVRGRAPLQRRNTETNNLINTREDAQLFLNMLNTLSSTPRLNNESTRLSISDINTHTSVSTYSLPDSESIGSEDTPEEEICLICRAPLEQGDVIRRLNNCPHYFHCSCIDSWFEIRNTCPVCRHVITEEPETNIENNANTNRPNDLLINIDTSSNNNDSLNVVDSLD